MLVVITIDRSLLVAPFTIEYSSSSTQSFAAFGADVVDVQQVDGDQSVEQIDVRAILAGRSSLISFSNRGSE